MNKSPQIKVEQLDSARSDKNSTPVKSDGVGLLDIQAQLDKLIQNQ
jgi:hypothetical protein